VGKEPEAVKRIYDQLIDSEVDNDTLPFSDKEQTLEELTKLLQRAEAQYKLASGPDREFVQTK
jgi:hypothetical protein